MLKMRLTGALGTLAAALLLVLPNAHAQTPTIAEGADELRAILKPFPEPDPDSVDTVLTFTNAVNRVAKVKCVARDDKGVVIGAPIAERIPPRGLIIIRASNLAEGGDFIGSVRCKSNRRVIASGFTLAPQGLTALRVIQRHDWSARQIFFPVVASF